MPKKFVEVVVKATKQKQFVPEHFLGHPVLGAGIELPPKERAARRAAATETAPATPAADEKTAAIADDKEN